MWQRAVTQILGLRFSNPLKPFTILSTHTLAASLSTKKYDPSMRKRPNPKYDFYIYLFIINLKLLSPSRSGTLGLSRSVGPIEC